MKYISKLYFKSHSLKQTPFFKAKFLEYCNIYNNFLIKALFLFQHSKLFVRIVFYKSAFSNIAIYHLILAQVFSCEFCEISKNTFFLRTPLVAASENLYIWAWGCFCIFQENNQARHVYNSVHILFLLIQFS